MENFPTARPRSLITGERIEKIEWGPNWEEILGGEFAKRSKDQNFEGVEKEIYGQFENTFMMYLPRLCEHCLNPSCAASCPSGAIYKREEDGIVLIDQEKCRGWRMCVSGCPYKKSTTTGRAANPRSAPSAIRASRAGSRRSARKPASGASATSAWCSMTPTPSRRRRASRTRRTSTRPSSTSSSTPNDPVVQEMARADGVPHDWIEAAKRSPVWKMAMDWKIAFPLHPEYRTLPMVWYVPPLSPIQNAAEAGLIGHDREMPDVKNLRIPVRYLANLLTAGKEAPIVTALERMLAMRGYMRAKTVDGVIDEGIAERVGLTGR